MGTFPCHNSKDSYLCINLSQVRFSSFMVDGKLLIISEWWITELEDKLQHAVDFIGEKFTMTTKIIGTSILFKSIFHFITSSHIHVNNIFTMTLTRAWNQPTIHSGVECMLTMSHIYKGTWHKLLVGTIFPIMGLTCCHSNGL